MKKIYLSTALATLFPMIISSCSDQEESPEIFTEKIPIVVGGEIRQINETRANDSGFADKDVAGAYIVDYFEGQSGTLSESGNRASNLRLVFDESSYRWVPAYDIYFKDANTPVDIYSYYPYVSSVNAINQYDFEVAQDQSEESVASNMGGYEQSDFLWAKAECVSPKPQATLLQYHHVMASAKVVLRKGSGFEAEEWEQLLKQVMVRNTVRTAKIDLATGTVTPTGEVPATGIIAYEKEDFFRAIVVPQTLATGTKLLSINVGDQSYGYTTKSDVQFIGGKITTFTFDVNKKVPQGDYEFNLVGESITPWENDDMAHSAILKEYVIIHNEIPGELDKAIEAAGKSLEEIRNIKITGEINTFDFCIMRDKMPKLQALNLKEVTIAASEGGQFRDENIWLHDNGENEIPINAMRGKQTLVSLVLPDKLKALLGESGGNNGAFAECSNLSGSLVIPEGVEEIGIASFAGCKNLTGTLSLPSTLKTIGKKQGYAPYWDGAFYGCGFVGELKIPESVEVIGLGSFGECNGLYGELKLPDGLKALGEAAFNGCRNLQGSLSIPQGVIEIPQDCFANTGLNGNLYLHDGITTIAANAFAHTRFKGALELPSQLKTISSNAFNGCDFSGELKLPETLESIGDRAFGDEWGNGNWRLMGTIEIPEGVISIGEYAFANCRMIEGLVFPQSLENIRNGAFYNCFGIGSIVCKSEIPPHILGGAFEGVAKDNFTLEVPEASVTDYKTENGWMEFKRISAHHELVVRPSIANALNTQCTRTLVLNAEGEWMVESKPEWVSLSATEGSNKAELELTFAQMPAQSETREGEVVFKLKNKDYRTRCKVSQYDYQYGEDEIITLQKASKGNNGGINLVFLGDGFDAKDISQGELLKSVKEEVEDFFAIEPYSTYRDYFNVFTAIPVSTESGIGTINTIRYAKFETTFTGGVGLRADYDAIFDYAMNIPEVTPENKNQLTVVMIPNSKDYGGICYMYEDGSSIAFCPMSDYGYPLDTRGVVQHEAGGHGFGKLGDEYIYHNEFIDMCNCTCCGHTQELLAAKSMGWFDNLELTGKMHEVGWSHLIFDDRYSDIVDIYEGGYMHNRGVYRSEQNSCMNNDIPYYSTISRESIVKRIKSYAGEEYSFEDFVANDSREVGAVTRANDRHGISNYYVRAMHAHPVFMKSNK